MKGPKIVAAAKGIVNMTVLNNLSPQDKADIRRLLEIINLCLHSPAYNLSAYRLANTYQTRYRWVVNDLYNLVTELREIAQDTQENISESAMILAKHVCLALACKHCQPLRQSQQTFPGLSLFDVVGCLG